MLTLPEPFPRAQDGLVQFALKQFLGQHFSAYKPHYRNHKSLARHYRRYRLRLAHFFGTSAEFWLNLQSLYDPRVAEQKAGKAIRSLPKLKHREPMPV